MGAVYLVEDKWNNNETRVIKQLINRPTGDEFENQESVRLFSREADILKKLDHHSIVKFHDYWATEDGKYFLVMDYVPGRNLEAIVNNEGPLSSELVVRIAIHCCDALDYLHNQPEPIIYRDLKPSNLMLTPDGRIIFIDFGIARQFMPKDIATRVVTAGYSPPEQYFGKPEIRSDIYSLGATMSHLLTGIRPKPLTGANPAVLNPKVMPSLNNLIRKMTAHEVDDRPASANAVRFSLYAIYKEIHPEFEIPEDPDSMLYDERAQAQQAARLKYGGHPKPRPISGGLLKAVRPSVEEGFDNGHYASNGDASNNGNRNRSRDEMSDMDDGLTGWLVHKFKRWLGLVRP